jgi:hypothetical protein
MNCRTRILTQAYVAGSHGVGYHDQLLRDWQYFRQRHFLFMCTKWFSDGGVHKYFYLYFTFEAFQLLNVLLISRQGRDPYKAQNKSGFRQRGLTLFSAAALFINHPPLRNDKSLNWEACRVYQDYHKRPETSAPSCLQLPV